MRTLFSSTLLLSVCAGVAAASDARVGRGAELKSIASLGGVGGIAGKGFWNEYYRQAEEAMEQEWKCIFPLMAEANFHSVFEVAAGACRNTEKLLPLAGKIVVSDVDPEAIAKCKQRFKGRPEEKKISYVVVDGTEALPLADSSITFVYQFDAGVHFHPELIRSYLKEFARVLKPGGTGFFHHSNLGALKLKELGVRHIHLDVRDNPSARSNMTRAAFASFAREAGLEMTCHPTFNKISDIRKVIGRVESDLPQNRRALPCSDLDAFAIFRKPGGARHRKINPEVCPTRVEAGTCRTGGVSPTTGGWAVTTEPAGIRFCFPTV